MGVQVGRSTVQNGGFRPGQWACIHAADAAAAAAFDWAARADDPMVFPAQVADGLLPQLPPTALLTAEFDHVGKRGAERFAARLRARAPDRLVGLYVQPGTGHGIYGTAQGARDEAGRLIIRAYL